MNLFKLSWAQKLPQPKCCDPNLQFTTKSKQDKESKSSKSFKMWLHYHKCSKSCEGTYSFDEKVLSTLNCNHSFFQPSAHDNYNNKN